MVALFSAIFISCDKEKGFTVSGTIIGEGADWDNVSVTYEDPLIWLLEDRDPIWVASAPISNGKFSIELPTPEAKYLQPVTEGMPSPIEGMPPQIKVSDKTAKGAAAQICALEIAEINGGTLEGVATLVLGTFKAIPPSMSIVQYMYVDKKVNITGTFDEMILDIPGKFTFDMKMKKGWNTVVLTTTMSSTGITATYKTGAVPSDAVWTTEFGMGMGVPNLETLLSKVVSMSREL